MNQQIIDYIKQQRAAGLNDHKIKQALLDAGWKESEISGSFDGLNNSGKAASGPQSLTKLPGAIDLFTEAWEFYKKRFKIFVGIMAIPTIFLVVLSGGLVFVTTGLEGSENELMIGGIITVAMMVLMLVGSIVQAWGQVALLVAINSKGKISVSDAYREGLKKIIPYWWVGFLAGFIAMGGYFLFFIPGIIFSVWFALAVYVLIAEDVKGMDAVMKSKEYVRGNWGEVFWYFLFIGIAYAGISFLITLALIPFNQPIISTVLFYVLFLFFGPLVVVYSFFVYKKIKVARGFFTFSPSQGQKTGLIIVGILGALAMMIFIPLIAFLSMQSAPIQNSIENRVGEWEEDNYDNYFNWDSFYEDSDTSQEL